MSQDTMSFDQAKSKVGSVWEAAKQKMDDSINEVHEYRQYSGKLLGLILGL